MSPLPSITDSDHITVKARMDARRNKTERTIDILTTWSGSTFFLSINCFIFIAWIALNSGIFPEFKAFDPFPFSLLTSAVSLEAIILSVLVLISQNRAAFVADLREELQLQVNVISEKELTEVLRLVAVMAKKQGIKITNPDIAQMLSDTDTLVLEDNLEEEMSGAKKTRG